MTTDSHERIYGVAEAVPVTPNDDIDLPWGFTRAVYVSGQIDLTVIFVGDTTNTPVTMPGLAAGAWHPIAVKRILATGTDPGATGAVILAGR